MKLRLSSTDPKSCPHCGAVLEDENIYCGSCGADLTKKEVERAADKRLITHRPKEEDTRDDIFEKDTESSRKLGRFTPGSQDSGNFDSDTFAAATYKRSANTNARIGVILGIIGFVINAFYIVTIIGLNFVKQAETNNEDIATIQIAKILLLIQFIEQTAIYVSLIVLAIFRFAVNV